MKKLRKKQKQVLAMLSDLSRRDLQKIQRLKVNALSIIEIHAKDVIDKMYKTSVYCFILSQEMIIIHVCCCNSIFIQTRLYGCICIRMVLPITVLLGQRS